MLERTISAAQIEENLISVIIPSYNRAHTLERAVRSALDQDYSPLEVIIVDDGSEDNTAQVVTRAFGQDLRVRYLRQENGGVCAARNTGLVAARGEFIAMLDSDDYWLPGKLRLQLEILKRHPELSLTCTDMDAIGVGGNILHARYLRTMYNAYSSIEQWPDLFTEHKTLHGTPYLVGDIMGPMVIGNLIHTSTVVARAERLRKAGFYDAACHPSEDQDYYFRVCETGPVALADAVLVHYTIGGEDAASSPKRGLALSTSYLHVLEKLMDHEGARKRLKPDLLRPTLAGAHRWVGRSYLSHGESQKARHHFWQALKISPEAPETAKYLAATFLPNAALRVVRAGLKKFWLLAFSPKHVSALPEAAEFLEELEMCLSLA